MVVANANNWGRILILSEQQRNLKESHKDKLKCLESGCFAEGDSKKEAEGIKDKISRLHELEVFEGIACFIDLTIGFLVPKIMVHLVKVFQDLPNDSFWKKRLASNGMYHVKTICFIGLIASGIFSLYRAASNIPKNADILYRAASNIPYIDIVWDLKKQKKSSEEEISSKDFGSRLDDSNDMICRDFGMFLRSDFVNAFWRATSGNGAVDYYSPTILFQGIGYFFKEIFTNKIFYCSSYLIRKCPKVFSSALAYDTSYLDDPEKVKEHHKPVFTVAKLVKFIAGEILFYAFCFIMVEHGRALLNYQEVQYTRKELNQYGHLV